MFIFTCVVYPQVEQLLWPIPINALFNIKVGLLKPQILLLLRHESVRGVTTVKKNNPLIVEPNKVSKS